MDSTVETKGTIIIATQYFNNIGTGEKTRIENIIDMTEYNCIEYDSNLGQLSAIHKLSGLPILHSFYANKDIGEQVYQKIKSYILDGKTS